jgi:hypothetical protein
VAAIPAATADDAVVAAERIGWPVVIKLDAPGLAHKSDVGGVIVGVNDEASARDAFEALIEAARSSEGVGGRPVEVRGVLVQPQAEPDVQLIVGAERDPHYGPLVIVGLGGILAEALDDIAIRLAPVSAADAAEMLDELRGAAVLRGSRGRPAVDRASVVELVVAMGRAIVDHPDWLEVDLNPVVAGPSRALAVDALVVLDREIARGL